jgi:hypothetical protein
MIVDALSLIADKYGPGQFALVIGKPRVTGVVVAAKYDCLPAIRVITD